MLAPASVNYVTPTILLAPIPTFYKIQVQTTVILRLTLTFSALC